MEKLYTHFHNDKKGLLNIIKTIKSTNYAVGNYCELSFEKIACNKHNALTCMV